MILPWGSTPPAERSSCIVAVSPGNPLDSCRPCENSPQFINNTLSPQHLVLSTQHNVGASLERCAARIAHERTALVALRASRFDHSHFCLRTQSGTSPTSRNWSRGPMGCTPLRRHVESTTWISD